MPGVDIGDNLGGLFLSSGAEEAKARSEQGFQACEGLVQVFRHV